MESAVLANLFFTTLVNVCSAAPASPQAAPLGFDAWYTKVLALRDKGDPRSAKRELLALLEATSEREHAQQRSAEILALLRDLSFREADVEPDVKSLIKGDLVSYDKASGQIRLRYTAKQLQAFGEAEGAQQLEDGKIVVHPLAFAGAHSIEILGDEFPTVERGVKYYPLRIAVCANPDGYYELSIEKLVANETSGKARARMILHQGTKEEEVANDQLPTFKSRNKYSLKVAVTANEIRLLLNNGVVIKAPRKGRYGSVGLGVGGMREVILEGVAEKSWLQGRVDDARHKRMKDFEAKFEGKRQLPAWLFEGGESKPKTKPARNADLSQFPDRYDAATSQALFQWLAKLDQAGDPEDLLKELADKNVAGVPENTRLWLRIITLQALGRYREALPPLDQLLANKPEYLPGRIARAQALFRAYRRPEAISMLEKLLAEHPDHEELTGIAARQLLVMGRFDEAKAVVDKAAATGMKSDLLKATADLVTKAIQGPNFPRKFQQASAAYRIVSDIDQKTCTDALAVLDESLRMFSHHLEALPKTDQQFRVYVFSGEAGYQAYSEGLFGMSRPNTAGLYYPAIKQLLIWNLPRREEMLRTVRHEGFHQYLDRLMNDPPTWFNEGMAEYFELARLAGSNFKFGEINLGHLRALKLDRRFNLQSFLYESAEQFYPRAQYRYAESWAFIHFLRHGPPAKSKTFEALWKALRTNPDPESALASVFPSQEIPALQKAFESYVGELISGGKK